MDDIAAKPALAGVLGHPVTHSKSPLIHNTWIRHHGLSALYAPLDVAPERFGPLLALAPALGFRGFNVTAPLKEIAFSHMSAVSDRAKAAGSVNTVVFDSAGRASGDSTDGRGFLANLAEYAPNLALKGAVAAMIGAGGAARAVAAALIEAGVSELRIANRTIERAEALAEKVSQALGGRITIWPSPPEAAFFEGASLIVNGASAGMHGADGASWRLPALAGEVVATDMVYAPLETPFLKAAASAGAKTVDGLGMLLHQAKPGFEAWFGVKPDVTPALRRAVLEDSGFVPGARL